MLLLLFLLNIGIAGYEDDNTPNAMNKSTNEIVPDIKMAPEWLFTWFRNDSMKADKLHYILTDTDFQGIGVCNKRIESSFCEKLLRIKIDTKLKLEEHVEILCKKASQKINALPRISSYMSFQQKVLVLNPFVISHISHCPIVWMLHIRRLNNRINSLNAKVAII